MTEHIGIVACSVVRKAQPCVIAPSKKSRLQRLVLGCTEIPLLVTQKDSSLPLLDSTRLLAGKGCAEKGNELG
ncbi:MAG: hypothetical protein U9O85_09565 [Euryarchaeota archaeon]|nr:hypothetical protein [Euryarchaeota archaeon]